MRSQNMDPNLVLLYECVKTVGTKKIDFKEVGKALGVNAAAARMRYSRFEFKMKNGRTIKSNITSNLRPTIKKSEANSKLRTMAPAARKRNKRAESESESAVSSDGDKYESESEEDVKKGGEARTFQRQTRGVKISLKDAFDNSDDDTESSFDGYDETAEKNNGDEDLSGIENATKARSSTKNSGMARQFRRSGSPPLTPGRFVRSKKSSMSPLPQPSTQESIVETNNAGSTSEMNYDQQIKQEFSVLKSGMILPLSNQPRSPTAFHKISAGSTRYVKESDIFESIERDDEEERKDFESLDQEMGEGGEDEDEEEEGDEDGEEDGEDEEEAEPAARTAAMGSPPVLASKKNTSYTSGCAPQ